MVSLVKGKITIFYQVAGKLGGGEANRGLFLASKNLESQAPVGCSVNLNNGVLRNFRPERRSQNDVNRDVAAPELQS
jgi:hypothetical protein